MYEVVDDDITGKKIVVCKPCMDDHVKFSFLYRSARWQQPQDSGFKH